MTNYYPDVWRVIKVEHPDQSTFFKVMGGWYGGYGGSDSWRLNSGIVSYKLVEGGVEFIGDSGSVYHCGYGVSCERMTALMGSVFSGWQSQLEGQTASMTLIDFEQFKVEFNGLDKGSTTH